MIQSINRERFEILVNKLKMESFMELTDFSNEILFVHPTISLFFDKLSMIRFNHNEILYSSALNFDSVENIFKNKISSSDFEVFKKNSLDFKVISRKKELKFKCVSPEFGLFWILQDINSTSVLIALSLLEFCDLTILHKYQYLFSSAKKLNFILNLGETSLNRFDIIWKIIEENKLTDKLNDFPLFLDRNIRDERRYDKIL